VARRQRGYSPGVQRAIVIGAGHNGLVCAAELARAGVEVIVVDQAPKVGGAVGSAELTLPGFVHDTCAAFMPVARASPAMLAQPLERYGVEWIDPPVIVAHPFADGSACTLHRDLAATAASLNSVASGSGDAWQALLTRVLPHGRAFAESVFHRFPPVGPGARMAAGLHRDLIDLTRRWIGSAEALGQTLFGAERPTAWLSGASMHSGLPPSAAGSGAFGFLLDTSR
jgi:phytoene dehydrogenase-like protein